MTRTDQSRSPNSLVIEAELTLLLRWQTQLFGQHEGEARTTSSGTSTAPSSTSTTSRVVTSSSAESRHGSVDLSKSKSVESEADESLSFVERLSKYTLARCSGKRGSKILDDHPRPSPAALDKQEGFHVRRIGSVISYSSVLLYQLLSLCVICIRRTSNIISRSLTSKLLFSIGEDF
jgi:hypothetical protein